MGEERSRTGRQLLVDSMPATRCRAATCRRREPRQDRLFGVSSKSSPKSAVGEKVVIMLCRPRNREPDTRPIPYAASYTCRKPTNTRDRRCAARAKTDPPPLATPSTARNLPSRGRNRRRMKTNVIASPGTSRLRVVFLCHSDRSPSHRRMVSRCTHTNR